MITFKSRITISVLNYFFLNQEARHYINELAKILDLDPKNLYRKLAQLEKEGLLKSEFRGKERYFFLNSKYPLLDHYRQIFLKTYGLEGELEKALMKVKGIKEAYIYGSYARNKMDSSSDIDVLIIGDHSIVESQRKINQLQKESGREINVLNLSEQEYKEKKKNKDQFLKNVFAGKIIKLI
jgi:predicted nucleotidyltransferase